jgi:hypothetical protein
MPVGPGPTYRLLKAMRVGATPLNPGGAGIAGREDGIVVGAIWGSIHVKPKLRWEGPWPDGTPNRYCPVCH